MPVRDLPPQPSLRHLKNEAKQLHKALLAGEPGVSVRVRAHLPRLTADATVDDVSLMEAQHVLGREYGFHEWPHLAAAVELEFSGLASLSHEDTHRLLREVDQKDLVVSLKLATEEVKERMLTGMSERVRTFITEEMEFLGPMPEEEILEVQGRILQQVRLLAIDGVIGWPPGADTPPPEPRSEPGLEPGLAAVVCRPLDELSLDEIRTLVHGLSVRARAHSILSLETAAKATPDGFVREGLRLAVDGTEPALIDDILHNRTRALLQSFDNRLRMTIEACAAIRAGDNPRIVAHKLHSLYTTDFDEEICPEHGTVAKLRERLRGESVAAMHLATLTETFVDIATIARRQGRAAVAEILDDLDDEFVRAGLRQVADGVEHRAIIMDLEARMPPAIKAYSDRYRLFTAGIAAIQEGRIDAALDASLDDAALPDWVFHGASHARDGIRHPAFQP